MVDFLEIDGASINNEIIETNFTCDVSKCKGACCTMESDWGAPLKEEEVDEIAQILVTVKDYLPKEHIKEIDKNGFYVKKHGDYMTRSLNNRACVFVYYEGDIAKCGIEKAFFEGKVGFQKPVSCHLFPIRITNFGGPVLRFEKYLECSPALEKGEKTQIKIIDFCKDSLEREFGKSWFIKTKKSIGS